MNLTEMHGAKMPFYFSSKFSGVFILCSMQNCMSNLLTVFFRRNALKPGEEFAESRLVGEMQLV